MDIANIFEQFLKDIQIQNSNNITSRFNTISKRLNKDFHDLKDSIENGVYIGSFGRGTAIDGISDLDMIFILPDDLYTVYNNREGNGQSNLLQDVKKSIQETYSSSTVRGDGQVVVVEFSKDYIEVCPVFAENDGSYTYPDSNDGGSWKKTNPVPENDELISYNETTRGNLINVCQMIRAWKNKCGVKIGGLLIDTFVYNFFKANTKYHTYNESDYDVLVRDFFGYLKNLDSDKSYWLAPGSNQRVYKKNSNFKSKAKKALKNVEDAIAKNEQSDVYEIWRKVFGKSFPYPKTVKEASINYSSSEEYIEDICPLNINYQVRIDCRVTQAGFRTELLRNMMDRLKKSKKLEFFIDTTDVPEPFDVKWKIKNEGGVAKQRNCLRGQIVNDSGSRIKKESSDFEGAHYVECYIIKNGFCVARDRIDVPISQY